MANCRGEESDTQGAMVRWTFHAPAIYKVCHTASEPDPAVGIADLEHRTRDALSGRRKHFERAFSSLRDP